ncbi:hypothetical protein [Microbacterium candidum]|uniref:Uncharacterized protein n=1 Tax=Microbacterium candidum TaxID=3041922 RepID=A0ABT7MZR2_9MICO|nr:hypothetical protein [Microbacterium sp. ASV49]MDL9979927.1 hypothetical protein [Microbacterium sp. ASV49]
MKIIKRIAIVFVVAFALFFVATRPQEAAAAVQGAVGIVWGAGQAVVHFFSSLAAS